MHRGRRAAGRRRHRRGHGMTIPLVASQLPRPLGRRGKVRGVYEVDRDALLLVASDRVSAFDVVLREPVAHKGAVLTQLSAFWFARLGSVMPSHFISADADAIVERVPALEPFRAALTGRAMLVRRTTPVPFECIVRGYITGSAWAEYQQAGTLAGGPLRAGRGAAELRQAAAARLPGGSEAAGEVGRQRTAAAAARGGSAGDERAVSGGVPTDHWEDLGDCVTVRFAPEGWPFIIPGWALVFLGAWVAQGSPWLWVPEVALVLL